MNGLRHRQRYRAKTLVVGDGSGPLFDVHFSVEGGRFTSIESATAGDLSDVETVDLGDAAVIPGLIDTHVHLSYDGGPHGSQTVFGREKGTAAASLQALTDAQAHLRAGFTTLRVLGSPDHVDVAVRESVDSGLFVGPRILAGGQAIGTTGGHMDRGNLADAPPPWVFDSPDGARAAARRQIKAGVDCLKIAVDGLQWTPRQGGRVPRGPLREMSFGEIQAVCEAAEWAGVHVAAHSDGSRPALRDALRAGVRTIEHIKDFDDDDLARIRDAGAFLVPTMVATSNTLEAGSDASGLSAVQYSFFLRQWDVKRRAFEKALKIGVPMVVGTDAGYALCRHGSSARELEKFVECGMTPLEAVSAATGVAADAIGIGDDVGTIASGKAADFVVVQGDPLHDVSILRRPEAIQAVYINGTEV